MGGAWNPIVLRQALKKRLFCTCKLNDLQRHKNTKNYIKQRLFHGNVHEDLAIAPENESFLWERRLRRDEHPGGYKGVALTMTFTVTPRVQGAYFAQHQRIPHTDFLGLTRFFEPNLQRIL